VYDMMRQLAIETHIHAASNSQAYCKQVQLDSLMLLLLPNILCTGVSASD